MASFHDFRNAFIPPELRRDAESLTLANRVVAFHFAMFLWVPVFAIYYSAIGAPITGNIVLSGGVIAIGSLLLLRRGKSLATCTSILYWGAWYVYTAVAFCTGGAQAPVIVWYASLPVLSILLSGTRTGIFWSLMSALTISAFYGAGAYGYEFLNEVKPSALVFTQFVAQIGLLYCVFILVCVLKNMEHSARGALHQAAARLEMLASLDGLLEIANRRGFDVAFEQEWKRHVRAQQPLSVALIDADLFKQYNDVMGHLAGDECLKAIAKVIRAGISRPGDFAARFGGEEFALILPDTDEHGALRIVESIREQVKAIQIPHPRSDVSEFMTISIGLATMIPNREDSYTEFLRQADRALYKAKALGRNQTVHSAEMLVNS